MNLEEQIGEKIRSLRNKNSLTQEELADRTELTKGFISQLERGQTAPSVSTLADIVECLGTNLSDFFRMDEDIQIVYPNEDYFVKEDDKGNEIQWLVSNAQSQMLEPILVKLQPGEEFPEDRPHEGEEFGYVINGSIRLQYGNQEHIVREGDSFCYPADKVHKISSACEQQACFIWISTPPNF